MRSTVLIAMMTAAAAGFGSAFADAEDIALSLVHPKGRVDVPVSALGEVKAAATYAFRNSETGQVHEYPNPHVSVCFSDDIQKRICELTRQVVGQPMEIVIDCATISKPIVREPLCAGSCFQVTANDIAERSPWRNGYATDRTGRARRRAKVRVEWCWGREANAVVPRA